MVPPMCVLNEHFVSKFTPKMGGGGDIKNGGGGGGIDTMYFHCIVLYFHGTRPHPVKVTLLFKVQSEVIRFF